MQNILISFAAVIADYRLILKANPIEFMAQEKMYHISQRALREGTILTIGTYGERLRRKDFIEQNYEIHVKEEVFELIRAAHYPQAPSRFNAVFLYPEFSIAKEFYANHFDYQNYVYEVEVLEKTAFVAEMDLLKCDGLSFQTISSNAHKYWQQIQHPNSGSLEVVLSGKAIVRKAVLEPSSIWDTEDDSFLSPK